MLARLAEATLAVHGQNDQLRLLRPAEQRALLDRFAGDAVAGPLERYRAVRAEWLRVAAELVERRDGARRLAQEADLLRHGLTEIARGRPAAGRGRRAGRRWPAGWPRPTTCARSPRPRRPRSSGPTTGRPGRAGRARADRRRPAPARRRRRPRAGRAGRAGSARRSRCSPTSAPSSPATSTGSTPTRSGWPQVLARQAELKALTRKYAADVDGVLAWADAARERLAGLDTSDEALAALAARRDELAVELAGHAAAVTAARTEAAARLAAGATAELAGLAMPDARLLVAVVAARGRPRRPRRAAGRAARCWRPAPTASTRWSCGWSRTPAPAPQPLHKGASGGELSRVMLALEVALAGADPVPTMVFDEVDAGVGGRAAVEIGRRLARLAARHQVIVVTHLPQVAAYADRHLVVDKSARGGTAPPRSSVRTLAEADRIVELARMLAGLDDTDTGRAHAEELLAAARAHRDADRAADRGAGTPGTGRKARRAPATAG